MIQLYNTLTKTKERLISRNEKKIQMFVCGPTVFDYIHIGNARTFVFFDVIAKYLRHEGYGVDYIQNITDIDDKIITRAKEDNREPLEYAKEYYEKFKEDISLEIEKINATKETIKELNKKWAELGNDPVGISKQEFCYFIPTTINYKNISQTVEEIILLRLKLKGKDKKEQIKIKREYFANKTNKFFGDPKGEHLDANLQNLEDYGDNAIRYFKKHGISTRLARASGDSGPCGDRSSRYTKFFLKNLYEFIEIKYGHLFNLFNNLCKFCGDNYFFFLWLAGAWSGSGCLCFF